MEQRTITTTAEIRSINQEERSAEFTISTESVDRHGTVFKMDGWELDNYNRNPIVCYNHRSHSDDPDDVIGLSEVYKDGDTLVGRVVFEEDNKKAEKVWRKVNKGTLKMASVGARVHEWRWGIEEKGEDEDVLYFTRQELIEWSVVTAGSNPDAFKRSAENICDIKKGCKRVIKEGMSAATKSMLDLHEVKKTTLK